MTTGAITLRSGSAFGTGGTGGTPATLSVTGAGVALGAITTTGGNDGDGSAIAVNAGGNLSVGAIVASGGAGNANTAGGRAGTVLLASSGGSVTTAAITANGGAGGSGAGAAGGNASTLTVHSNGTLSTGAVLASGGAGGGTTGAGGSGGAITLANLSSSTGTVTATNADRANRRLDRRDGERRTRQHHGRERGADAASGRRDRHLGSRGRGRRRRDALTSAGNVITSVSSSRPSAERTQCGHGGCRAACRPRPVTIEGVDRDIARQRDGWPWGRGRGRRAGGNAGNVVVTGATERATADLYGRNQLLTGAAAGTGAGGTPGNVRLEGTASAPARSRPGASRTAPAAR